MRGFPGRFLLFGTFCILVQLSSFLVNAEFSDVLSIPAEDWDNAFFQDSGLGFPSIGANESPADESEAASSGFGIATVCILWNIIMVVASLLLAVM